MVELEASTNRLFVAFQVGNDIPDLVAVEWPFESAESVPAHCLASLARIQPRLQPGELRRTPTERVKESPGGLERRAIRTVEKAPNAFGSGVQALHAVLEAVDVRFGVPDG